MIRKLKIIFIYVHLIQIKINIRVFGLKHVIKNIHHKPIVARVIQVNPSNYLLATINRFYNKKLFSCLECAIFLKKFFSNFSEIKLFIGIKNKEQDFESHAWVKKGEEYVFGLVKDINEYKEILRL
jgi:hypothetical protein